MDASCTNTWTLIHGAIVALRHLCIPLYVEVEAQECMLYAQRMRGKNGFFVKEVIVNVKMLKPGLIQAKSTAFREVLQLAGSRPRLWAFTEYDKAGWIMAFDWRGEVPIHDTAWMPDAARMHAVSLSSVTNVCLATKCADRVMSILKAYDPGQMGAPAKHLLSMRRSRW